ncbi:related to CYB2 - L-lactate dehydrogenase (cytochrome b2) [Ustilago trichophora]|uniref:Related to CYB2 - L-lactate dehydrogenase (Cytochrome b2) n=1 Tax=Ustilago trichophora TaxID=86804 RepID=A0A5C3DWM9_9BASI|nr:related to CYB2 - L-lactate dehydrogenase (cytochrome b2) [Ustilago trichophora]
MTQLTVHEIQRHACLTDAWLVIEGSVYDVTSYLDSHPGGKALLLTYAGKDATQAFKTAHSTSVLSQLPQHAYKGRLALATNADGTLDDQEHKRLLSDSDTKLLESQQRLSEQVKLARRRLPRLKDITNLDDMENAALTVLPPLAAAFYAGGSDTEASLQANRLSFSRYYFNPRVLKRVDTVDTSVTLFDKRYPLPIMGSAVGNTHMAGPDCDWHLTKGLAQCRLPHMVSTFAATSILELQKRAKAENLDAVHFLQLYVQRNHSASAQLVTQAMQGGAHAVFVTVDVAQIGNREKDRKIRAEAQPAPNWPEEESRWIDDGDAAAAVLVNEDGLQETGVSARGSAATSTAGMDRDLNWDDIAWIKKAAVGKPVVLKGIQSLEDVLLAVEAGVDGIVLSNHGGRQLDFARPPMDLLYDLRHRHPQVFDKLDVLIDGGIRRGTDILKALCLGAKAVALGRPFVFAEAAYRHLGVVKTVRMLEEEILTGMRLLGAASIADLQPDMVERVDFYGPAIASHVASKHLAGRL